MAMAARRLDAGNGLSARALERATRYVESHLGESIRLAHVADAAAVSRFHFCRQFRAATGQTPMQFVSGRRIAVARELLASSGLDLCEIALRLGFCDQSHFSRVFHRATGHPPGRYAQSRINPGSRVDARS
jgi:transcriptional regulator GlxA family with amidase domain